MGSRRTPSMLSIAITLFVSAWLVQPAVAQMGWTTRSPDGIRALNGISFSDPMNGYAVGTGSVLRTTDGGQTWDELLPAFLFNVDQTAVYARSADTVWTVSGLTFQVRHSKDGGESWRTSTLGSGAYWTIAFSDAGVGIVAGRTGQRNAVIERTVNGETWTRVFLFNGDDSQFNSVRFADDQNVWAVGRGAFARSTNSGRTWTAQNPIGDESILRDIFFLDVNTGWIAALENIYSTVDGGTTWELVGAIRGATNGIAGIWFTSAHTGWAIAGSKIHYTTNGGANWTSIGLTTNFTGGAMTDLLFVEPDVGWAVGGSFDGETGVIVGTNQATEVSRTEETPIEAASMQLFPNPLRRITTIHFNLDQPAEVSLKVYDILGRLVETLVNTRLTPGEHRVIWDRSRVGAGLYLVSLTAAGSVQTAKAIVID